MGIAGQVSCCIHGQIHGEAPRERDLTKEELPRFLRGVEDLANTLSNVAIKSLLITGVQIGEILRLQWHQLQMYKKRLFLPNTKNGKSRSIILNGKAMPVFKGLEESKEHAPKTKDSD